MDGLVDLVLLPISLFSGKPLAVTIALTILGTALCLWLVMHFIIERRFLGIYNKLSKSIEATRNATFTPEQKIANISKVFGVSRFSENWRQYSASFDYSDGHAFNYADPAPYFASDRISGHNYVKWSSTLGGVFLTVGLFFTFVGLSAALLQVAGDGHASMAPEQLRHAVESILGISSVKFITSLAGILAYIGWSLVARIQADAQDRAVDRLVAEIRRLSTYVSPEKTLLLQLRTQQAQHQQFQTFGTELAVAIGHQIEMALNGRLDALPNAVADFVGSTLANAMLPVRDELRAIGHQIGETGGQIAIGASDVFSQVWKSGMEVHMNAFGEQMGTMISALRGLPETVRRTEEGIGSEIGEATKRLNETLTSLGANFATQQTSMMGAVTDFNARVGDIPNIVAAASRDFAAAVGRSVEFLSGGYQRSPRRPGRPVPNSFQWKWRRLPHPSRRPRSPYGQPARICRGTFAMPGICSAPAFGTVSRPWRRPRSNQARTSQRQFRPWQKS